MTPTLWAVASLKRWTSVRPSNVDKHSVDGEESIRLCNYVDVYKNERITADLDLMDATATEPQIRRFTLAAGDVIVTKDSEEPTDIGVPAYVPQNLPGIVCGYHLALLRPDGRHLHGGFLHWALQGAEAQAYFTTAATGITRYSLSINDIGMLPLKAPSPREQERIANFLDEKTERIDALIGDKVGLSERLVEYRKAVISDAVTRGLRPDVPMAKTGNPWLGAIPAHWQLKRLKYLGEAIIGLTYAPDDVVDDGGGVLVLRSSNVQNGRISLDDNVYVSCEIPDKIVTRVGDILICSRNGSRALIGKNATIGMESAGVTFGAFMTIFRSAENSYLRWPFNSHLFEYQSASFLTSTINQLTVGNLCGFEIPVPPAAERKAIDGFLAEKVASIDSVRDHALAHIDRLREYRSSLISAAVTGQLAIPS